METIIKDVELIDLTSGQADFVTKDVKVMHLTFEPGKILIDDILVFGGKEINDIGYIKNINKLTLFGTLTERSRGFDFGKVIDVRKNEICVKMASGDLLKVWRREEHLPTTQGVSFTCRLGGDYL